VFFFYDPADYCSPTVERDDSGKVVKRGSAPIPPPQNLSCDHTCENDGEFSFIKYDPRIEQDCKRCPGDSIAISNGFRIDAKMDDEVRLQQKIQKQFDISCVTLHINDRRDDTSLGSISYVCPSWSSTGVSFKTPQFTKEQQREMAWNKNQSEIVEYHITYKDTFVDLGSVEFKYRANTKRHGGFTNGVFKFYIDGVD
jgi:hypothetical protein